MDDRKMDDITRSLAQATTRRQALRLFGGGALGVAGLAIGANRTAAQAGGVLNFPVNITNALGSFVGNFAVSQFIVRNGAVQAVGQLTGTVKNAAGTVLGTVDQALTLPVLGSTTGTCQILHLELGPLDLNLLGLIVHLDKVVLDITAQQGGGLLGDLLCAIAGLLDGNGGALGRLRNLLNQLLGALA